MTAAAVSGRLIDRGNANLRSIEADFRRIGIAGLRARLATLNPHWEGGGSRRGDKAWLQDLIAMRNALAHGNQRVVENLRSHGTLDTLGWARGRLPALNRICSGLDRVVWSDRQARFGAAPW